MSSTVAVRIESVKAVHVQAHLPGEVSGPGVAVGVAVANRSSGTVDLGNAVVTLTDSRSDPAGMVSDPHSKPLSGRLAPGHQSRGGYLFTVPPDRRAPVTVTVTLTGNSPVVQFVGTVR